MSKLQVFSNVEIKTMSSREIAELVESRHDDVKRSIERLAERGVIELPPMAEIKTATKPVNVYQVCKRDSYIIVAQLSPEFTAKLVDRWQELEAGVLPKTFSEALQLAADQAKKIEQQQLQLQTKDELILASNEASIKAGEILVREFVKANDIIDLGEHQFYEWMRDQGYILKASREPYQKYVKLGYFTWKPTEEKHGGEFRYTLRITPRGKVWLAARYMAYLDQEMAA